MVTLSAGRAFARCDDTADPDRSDIAAARAAVAANCDCAAMATHGAYVRCASDQIDAVLVNRDCRHEVRTCISHSTCGRPGAVTCCRVKAGNTKCKIARSAAACTGKGGTPGTCSSCCDACPAPGSGESCPVPTTTTVTTVTTLETSTVTTTTATVTTDGVNYCCVRTETCGAFNTCQEMTPAECQAAGGFPGLLGKNCSMPDACSHATTTTPPSACCVADQCYMTGFCECSAFYGGTFHFFQYCGQAGVCTTTTLPMTLLPQFAPIR
jgi:hypothetical protein